MRAAPRLLYLAYHFPPAPAIGSVRSWNTARWLSSLGWRVSVVTPEPSLWREPDEPERAEERIREHGLRRIGTGHRWPMLAPDEVAWVPGRLGWLLGGVCRAAARRLGVEAGSGWAGSAERACAPLRTGDFDLILATGGPYASFRLARRLSRRLGCPFVLDYRDPWTGNPHRRREGGLEEARLLRECAGATVVSRSWAELIGGTFGAREKLHVVSNGFDPELFAGVAPERFDHFAVVYAGTLYPPKRVLDPVLRAFAAFAGRAPAARFHYFGDFGGPVREAAARVGASSRVVVHERVSRQAALRAQKGAGLSVVVSSVEDDGTLSEKGTVTGKVFDCMALGRPALVVAPRGSDLREVAETAGGMRCFAGSEAASMSEYMGEVASGAAPPVRDPGAYRWDRIARDLDRLLRAAAGPGAAS